MSLAGDIVAHLAKRRVRCALIGAEALAVHGVARATLDSDLLVSTTDVLRESFWSALSPRAAVQIQHGDHDDPLCGVVRIRRRREQTDVIVGRPWTRRMLDHRMRISVAGQELPVIDRAGLTLLKLFAGGPQDVLDVRLLLEQAGDDLRDEVERRLPGLPSEIARAWHRVLPSSRRW